MPPVCKPDSFGLRPSVPSSTILGATQCYRQLVSQKMDLFRSPLHLLALSPGTFPRKRVKDVPRKRKPQSEHQKGSPLGHCLSECLTLHDARVCKRKNSSEVKLMMRTFLLCRPWTRLQRLILRLLRSNGEFQECSCRTDQSDIKRRPLSLRQPVTSAWRIQGEGPGGLDPSPIRPYACFRLKFLHRQDRIPFFNWLVCLMKRALNFATKLNSRDIKKCHWFWVPSYDLFASARKTVFPAPTANGVHRLRNTWSSP